jgi:hypothetical protein
MKPLGWNTGVPARTRSSAIATLLHILMWCLTVYITADFCDAGVPGAFNFSANDSIEVVHVEKPEPPTPFEATRPKFMSVPLTETRLRRADLAAAAMMLTWLPQATVAHPSIRSLSPEDCPPASPSA